MPDENRPLIQEGSVPTHSAGDPDDIKLTFRSNGRGVVDWDDFEGAEINGVFVKPGDSLECGGVTYHVGLRGGITVDHV
jgi:hypothetical protein